ncbi:MAG: hypothetical protein ACRD9W_04555, partial [Terriglobia bacterium]
IMTGDTWYLERATRVAAFDAARYIPEPTGQDLSGRGPNGTYGGINDEERGAGWVLRDRVEAAFAQPDGTPEKVYLTTLVNDALARWEGSLGLTGTAYDGTTMYNWGAKTGWYYGGIITPQHAWETSGVPSNPALDSNIQSDIANNGLTPDLTTTPPVTPIPGTPGAVNSTWMQWYVQWALGRANELGFTGVQPLMLWSGKYLTDMINVTGWPILITTYEIPDLTVPGNVYPDWGAFLGTDPAPNNIPALTTAYLQGGQLQAYFNGNLWGEGRPAYAQAALAPLVDIGAPGAAQAWAWMLPNVVVPISQPNIVIGGSEPTADAVGYQQDRDWDVIPRIDNNVLPAQPTVLQ